MLLSSTTPRDRGSNAAGELRPLLALLACLIWSGPAMAYAAPDAAEVPAPSPANAPAMRARLAQAQPLPPPASPAAAASTPSTPPDEPVGNVATLTGTASVIRNRNTLSLKLKDDIYLNDVLLTFADSALGITFNDDTTFNLTANASITVDNFIYEDGGRQNSALFDVTKGTVAFVASAVAKTGDMKITTPTATLGIRGTTGLVEVNGAGGAHNIKLYPDADGRVGHIDVSDRNGTRLGSLTQGGSGFALRGGPGGPITAAPLLISPQQAARDQGIVRQVYAAQAVGRQVVTEQRALRRANPRAPGQRNPPGQPGQRQNNLQQRPNGRELPGPHNRAGENRRSGQGGQSGGLHRATEHGQPQSPGAQRPNAPALRQGGLPNRPAPRMKRPSPKGKPPKERRR